MLWGEAPEKLRKTSKRNETGTRTREERSREAAQQKKRETKTWEERIRKAAQQKKREANPEPGRRERGKPLSRRKEKGNWNLGSENQESGLGEAKRRLEELLQRGRSGGKVKKRGAVVDSPEKGKGGAGPECCMTEISESSSLNFWKSGMKR